MEETGVITTSIPAVSVVIPVKNEALRIRACIEGILSQTIAVKEIIVIDSGSTDGTIEILQQYNMVKLVQIPSSEFNHGMTRNLGVSHASGEFVLLTVGDARSFNNTWIEELLKGFTDETVAGVCGQQVVPHEKDKNPVDWFRPVSKSEMVKYHYASPEEFYRLAPAQKKNICGWDDVNAMYRRSVLEAVPFRQTSYSEDAIWAKEAILKGYAIVYNPEAKVYHYHLEDADYAFKRNFTTMYFRYRQFGYLYSKPSMRFRQRVSIVRSLIKSLGLNVPLIFKWYSYNISRFNALVRAHALFMDSLRQGEHVLDKMHAELCGKPPIPLKE